MPSLEFMSEVKIYLWGELSDSSGAEQKKGKHGDSVMLHRSPNTSEGRWRNNPRERWSEIK